jgi:hypothetical protein
MTCTHAPAYQKGCIPCSVRYMKMLRSPDARLSRKFQVQHLSGLTPEQTEQVKAILKGEAA